MTLRFGPLQFVDSINIFPTLLALLIEDCKATCAGRNPSEAFSLLTERHSLFAAARPFAKEDFQRADGQEVLGQQVL